jgi:hypothetical protein
MTSVTSEITELSKLGRNGTSVSLKLTDLPERVTKKRSHAPAYIRSKKTKGHVYYYWHQEGRKEVYLGDADAVLAAVTKDREGASYDLKTSKPSFEMIY